MVGTHQALPRRKPLMRYTAAVLAASLTFSPLSACAELNQATTGSVSQVAPEAVTNAKKALIAAHALHQATAEALTIAANSNLCHAQCAVDAKKYLDQSAAYLSAADNLVKLGDVQGIEGKIAGATALISQVNGLLGAK